MDIELVDSNLNNLKYGQCINWTYMMNTRTYAMKCRCDKCFCLANHKVSSEGIVSPSVVCPFDCGFHEMIRIIK